MNLKILILLFPILLFGQNSKEELEKKKIIDIRIRYIDSVANFITEEIKNGEVISSHGGKGRKSYTNTRILRESGQVLRICYRIRRHKTDDDFSFYYLNSKLIYGELTVWHKKKRKSTRSQFYYDEEIPIYPSIFYSKFSAEDIETDVKIIIQSKDLLKQASS